MKTFLQNDEESHPFVTPIKLNNIATEHCDKNNVFEEVQPVLVRIESKLEKTYYQYENPTIWKIVYMF